MILCPCQSYGASTDTTPVEVTGPTAPTPTPPQPAPDIDAAVNTPLSEKQLDDRLQYLDSAFDDMRPGGIAWVVTWAVFFQGVFAFELKDAIVGTKNWMTSRPASIVGTVEAGISVVLTVAVPFRPMTARRKFHKGAAMNAHDKTEKLARGESLLLAANNDVDFVHSWLSHVVCLGISIVGGAIVWGVEGKDGWKHALIGTGVGIAINAINIWSAPMKAQKYYAAYREKYGPLMEATSYRPSGFELVVMPGPAGAAVGFLF